MALAEQHFCEMIACILLGIPNSVKCQLKVGTSGDTETAAASPPEPEFKSMRLWNYAGIRPLLPIRSKRALLAENAEKL
jgi:hypothetical protein